MNKLIVVDCTTGLVKACLSDKSTTIPAVPADERRGASLPHCPTPALPCLAARRAVWTGFLQHRINSYR